MIFRFEPIECRTAICNENGVVPEGLHELCRDASSTGNRPGSKWQHVNIHPSFQRGNPSLSSYKHRFQASIFHLHTVRWLQAKKASSEHVRTYPRSSIIRAIQRFAAVSRRAHTTTSHHIFDVYRRDPSETPAPSPTILEPWPAKRA